MVFTRKTRVRPFTGSGYSQDKNKPQSLVIKGLTYTVRKRSGPWWKSFRRPIEIREVLKDINLYFEQELTAVLGSSGAGKSSLLDVISSRVDGEVSGSVLYNGKECVESVVRENIAYVIQSDRLLPNLTVRETLTYAAYLRLPGYLSKEEVNKKVEKVIHQMGLTTVADSRIGGTISRGISGGEKRRVTIGVQLLQNTKVLLLDEPTTGLDSCTSKALVSRLGDIAKEGRIVIVTIHQPGSDLFKIFHKVCILSNGGLVYYGSPTDMLVTYSNAGYTCPKYTNPLDFCVDVASIDRRDMQKQKDSEARLDKLSDTYRATPQYKTMCQNVNTDNINTNKPVGSYSEKGPTIIRIQATLLSRMMVNLFRDRTAYSNRLFMLSLLIPSVCAFLGRLRDDQTGIQDRVGLLYQTLIIPPYIAALNVSFLFPALREVYLREYKDGLYSPVTFVIAYMLHVLPFQIIATFLFSTIVYWATGLAPAADKFFIYYAVVLVLHIIGEIMTVGAFCVIYNNQLAVNAVTLVLTASLLFASGLLRSIDSMIDPLQWIGWITIHKYITEILVVNEFHGLTLTCDTTDQCQYPTGDTYLETFYPTAVDNLDRNGGIVFASLWLFLLSTIFILKIRGVPNIH